MLEALDGRRVLFVVGKGGVGKSTVATALAVVLRGAGKRVLLAQMEPSRRLARVPRHRRRREGIVEALPNLCVLTVDGESALSEYLGLVLPVRRVQRMVVESKLYHHFVAAAPGLKELMTVGKIWYEEQLVAKGRPKWDVIVVDAPATGHVLQYLRMPSAAAEAFGPGLVRREAQKVMELLCDPVRTAVCPVTTAEEMPVNETAEMYQQLRERLRMPLGVLFVNRVHAAPLAPTDVPATPGRRVAARRRRPAVRARGGGLGGDQPPLPRSPAGGRADADRRAAVRLRRGVRPRRGARVSWRTRRGSSMRASRKARPDARRGSCATIASSCASAAAASARRRRPRRSRSGARSKDAARSCSRSTRRAGSPTRSGSPSSATSRAWSIPPCSRPRAVAVRGTLAAMMLDQKNAWDRLVARHAPSDEVRERILAEPLLSEPVAELRRLARVHGDRAALPARARATRTT